MPGGPEIMVILVIALLILGPEQLPKAMRSFGNVMAEIRKVSGGFQDEMRKAMDTLDVTGTDNAEKPHSATPTAVTPEQADVTEVVAKNPASPADAPSDEVGRPVDQTQTRPPVDPADRAAG